MTNAELITALQQLPPEAEAKVYLGWEEISISIDSVDGEELRSDRYPVQISEWGGTYSVQDVYYPHPLMVEKEFASEKEAEKWAEENGYIIGCTNED